MPRYGQPEDALAREINQRFSRLASAFHFGYDAAILMHSPPLSPARVLS
jgi:hypothetical protein